MGHQYNFHDVTAVVLTILTRQQNGQGWMARLSGKNSWRLLKDKLPLLRILFLFGPVQPAHFTTVWTSHSAQCVAPCHHLDGVDDSHLSPSTVASLANELTFLMM